MALEALGAREPARGGAVEPVGRHRDQRPSTPGCGGVIYTAPYIFHSVLSIPKKQPGTKTTLPPGASNNLGAAEEAAGTLRAAQVREEAAALQAFLPRPVAVRHVRPRVAVGGRVALGLAGQRPQRLVGVGYEGVVEGGTAEPEVAVVRRPSRHDGLHARGQRARAGDLSAR